MCIFKSKHYQYHQTEYITVFLSVVTDTVRVTGELFTARCNNGQLRHCLLRLSFIFSLCLLWACGQMEMKVQ